MFRSLRFPARLGQAVAENARCQQSSFLEMVRRRQTQRLLQLRGPPPREAQEQSGLDLRSGTGDGVSRRHHLPGTVQARKRSCRHASRFRRTKNRRPRHHSHAHDSGVAHHHAGLNHGHVDRKSTRLNSSRRCISYAVFCLKKKKKEEEEMVEEKEREWDELGVECRGGGGSGGW